MLKIQKNLIQKVRHNPARSGLLHSIYGKSPNIDEYSDNEIADMLQGAYTHSNSLLVDGDYILDLNSVHKAICVLEQITCFVKPTEREYRKSSQIKISNIRTFYISDYFLVSMREMHGETKHKITKYLWKVGAINKGKNNYKDLFSVRNHYKTLQDFNAGLYPKDLYHPIKMFINHKFFHDDYWIRDFDVESPLKVIK